jgi:hypothetical protein
MRLMKIDSEVLNLTPEMFCSEKILFFFSSKELDDRSSSSAKWLRTVLLRKRQAFVLIRISTFWMSRTVSD